MTDDLRELDALVLGHRVRARRTELGLTLDQLAARLDRAPSQVSAIENGHREPRLSTLRRLADALDTSVDELMRTEAPSRRAELEIGWERAQRSGTVSELGVQPIRLAKTVPNEVIEAMLSLYGEIERLKDERAATPEEARRVNVQLRELMRSQDNHFPELERMASSVLSAVGHVGGPLTQRTASDIAAHLGFSLHYVADMPHTTRSVADLAHGRLYLSSSSTDSRNAVLQALSSRVLGHSEPKGYAEFLQQRVETNYLAGALLMPESGLVPMLQKAKDTRSISIEDLRDHYGVSYETAAHRFTNVATRHLGIPVHFLKVHQSGTIIKAYENDDVNFPADRLGSIEGQMCCRKWTSRVVFDVADRFNPYYQYTDTGNGTYWCTARVEQSSEGEHSLSVGVRFDDTKWFLGRDTTNRSVSPHSTEVCCRRAPVELESQWREASWPSVRTPRTLLATLPTGNFPGVDTTEVYEFLERHAPEASQ